VAVEATRTLWRSICVVVLISAVGLCTAAVAAGRPQVAGLQVALRACGLYAGAIDAVPPSEGRCHPADRRTFRDTHRNRIEEVPARTHKLQPDGIAGRRTISALQVARPKHLASARPQTDAARVRWLIDYWAKHYGVDPTLMRALAWMESGYQPNLTSAVGALASCRSCLRHGPMSRRSYSGASSAHGVGRHPRWRGLHARTIAGIQRSYAVRASSLVPGTQLTQAERSIHCDEALRGRRARTAPTL
jgi:hypothetical protein